MTNAQKVFEKAMRLMDEATESPTTVENADTQEYKNRTLAILNVLRGECFPASDTFSFETAEKGKRPICPEIEDWETPIFLDDYICQSVLPYGLAAHLLLDENPTAASYFQQRYMELLAQAMRGVPSESEAIDNMYGGIEYGYFGRW